MSTPTLAHPTTTRALRRTDFSSTTGRGPDRVSITPPAAALGTGAARARRPRDTPREFTHAVADRVVDPAGTGTVSALPLGDPTALCCAVAHAATEVLRGIRPLHQLVRSVSPEVFDQLHARAQVREAARNRRGTPATPQSRSRVRRARVVRISSTVAEATVIVDDVDRVRAAALRVEEHRGRWRVVVLELG